eukprot:scaffold48343_cov21-Tisochrysis_lutea.AAC.1
MLENGGDIGSGKVAKLRRSVARDGRQAKLDCSCPRVMLTCRSTSFHPLRRSCLLSKGLLLTPPKASSSAACCVASHATHPVNAKKVEENPSARFVRFTTMGSPQWVHHNGLEQAGQHGPTHKDAPAQAAQHHDL